MLTRGPAPTLDAERLVVGERLVRDDSSGAAATRRQFLVRWFGPYAAEDSWVDAEEIPELIRVYEVKRDPSRPHVPNLRASPCTTSVSQLHLLPLTLTLPVPLTPT